MTYRHTNHDNLHVRGYKEEGTTTTPFDMTVRNELDRYHLALEAVRRLPQLHDQQPAFLQAMQEKLNEHHLYIREFGEDMPQIRNWTWGMSPASGAEA